MNIFDKNCLVRDCIICFFMVIEISVITRYQKILTGEGKKGMIVAWLKMDQISF